MLIAYNSNHHRLLPCISSHNHSAQCSVNKATAGLGDISGECKSSDVYLDVALARFRENRLEESEQGISYISISWKQKHVV